MLFRFLFPEIYAQQKNQQSAISRCEQNQTISTSFSYFPHSNFYEKLREKRGRFPFCDGKTFALSSTGKLSNMQNQLEESTSPAFGSTPHAGVSLDNSVAALNTSLASHPARNTHRTCIVPRVITTRAIPCHQAECHHQPSPIKNLSCISTADFPRGQVGQLSLFEYSVGAFPQPVSRCKHPS